MKFVTSIKTMLRLSLTLHLKKKKKALKNLINLIFKFSIYQYYFIYRFGEGENKVWKPCTTYLLDQDYNSGCLFKTEGPTLTISIRNSNGSDEVFSKNLKADFYSKYEKSWLLWQIFQFSKFEKKSLTWHIKCFYCARQNKATVISCWFLFLAVVT